MLWASGLELVVLGKCQVGGKLDLRTMVLICSLNRRYTIESTTTKHLIKQFKMAIQDALSSKTEVREQMRARSALQRFPVAQWVEDLGILQTTAIKTHQKYSKPVPIRAGNLRKSVHSMLMTPPKIPDSYSDNASMMSKQSVVSKYMPSSWLGPGRKKREDSSQGSSRRPSNVESSLMTRTPRGGRSRANTTTTIEMTEEGSRRGRISPPSQAPSIYQQPTMPYQPNSTSPSIYQPSLRELQVAESSLLDANGSPGSLTPPFYVDSHANSTLSLDSVVGNRVDLKLQAVDPFFIDQTGHYATNFETMLDSLDGKTSEDKLCIEDYLKKSEKQWYGRYHDAKLGKGNSPAVSIFQLPWADKSSSKVDQSGTSTPRLNNFDHEDNKQFGLSDEFEIPTGLKRLMLQKIGDWPVYAFLLAFVSYSSHVSLHLLTE